MEGDEHAEPFPWYSRLRTVAGGDPIRAEPEASQGIPFAIPPTRDPWIAFTAEHALSDADAGYRLATSASAPPQPGSL